MRAQILLLALGLGVPAAAQPVPQPAVKAPDTVPTAKTLFVGNRAPPLKIQRWLKGEPVKNFEPGHIYVVDLWATWCGPCLAAFPHLSDLQSTFADRKVTVLGINVADDPRAVEKFMTSKAWAEKARFTVGVEAPSGQPGSDEGAVWTEWLVAAKRSGIPEAFIVNKDGLIAWVGQPSNIDEPLKQIVAGEWDLAAAAQRHRREVENAERLAKLESAIFKARTEKDSDKVDALIRELQEVSGRTEADLSFHRFRMQMQCGSTVRAYEAARLAMKSEHAKDATKMNEIAWMIVDPDATVPQRDYDLARQAVKIAFDLTEGKDASVLDTFALCEFQLGNTARAIELQTAALSAATPDVRGEIEARLAKYKAALPK